MSGQHFRDYHLLLGERKWSRTRLAMGIGTCNVSAAARARPDVLETERHLETGRLIFLVGNDRAISLVDRGGEGGAGQAFPRLP